MPPSPEATAPELSVVVPVYRNEDTLRELLDRLEAALAGESFELVLVVDGSPDRSLELLREELKRRPALVVVALTRNFGQHAALCAGFLQARGRVALILDADLQQRPEDLPRFVARWREGYDFVSGRRIVRRDPWVRRFASFWLNLIARWRTGVKLADWGCPIAAVDREILDRIPAEGEKRRFLKPLVAQLSRRWVEVEVEGDGRDGESSYSFLALVGVALDFVVSFANRPFLKLAGLGFLGLAGSVAAGLVYLGLRLGGAIEPIPAVQVTVVLGALLGVQILVLGALGEFTHRIYRLVQGSPFFEVQATHAHGEG
ncbi:MAG: glycosyltransferase family 2 protein [Planctomycetota bacterium]